MKSQLNVDTFFMALISLSVKIEFYIYLAVPHYLQEVLPATEIVQNVIQNLNCPKSDKLKIFSYLFDISSLSYKFSRSLIIEGGDI